MLKLSLRFVVPLLLVVGALAYVSVPLIDRLTLRWFMSDLDQRSQAIAATMAEPLREAQQRAALARMTSLLNAAATEERLQSAALCDARGEVVARSAQSPDSVGFALAAAAGKRVLRLPQGVLHPTRVPLRQRLVGAAAALGAAGPVRRRRDHRRIEPTAVLARSPRRGDRRRAARQRSGVSVSTGPL